MQVQNLLNDVSIWYESHQKANALFSRQLAPNFQLFNLFNVNEVALSRCIAFLLDEKETHGQKDLFIKQFYKLLVSKNIKLIPNQYRVHIEHTIDNNRRLDILMTDGKHYIGIENKPWASDQKDQLKDYGVWLQKKANNNENWLLIYLCNNEINCYSLPKNTDSAIKENVLAVTFRELLTWLSDCVLYVQAPKVRSFVEDLIKFIQEEVNGEVDMTTQEELFEILLSKNDNLKNALLIGNNISALKSILFKKFITYINQEIKDLGGKVELDKDMEKHYAGFHIKFSQEDDFLLRWEFECANQKKLFYGIRRKDKMVKPNTELYNKIAHTV